MNNSTGAVTFLSLGPGDPELLTLKAVRTLREADVALIPATRRADNRLLSRTQDIIGSWVNVDKIRLYELPMNRRRGAAMEVYDQMRLDAAEACRSGQRVVVAVEGDVSIYASIHYVLEHLQADGIPVVQCPGIPSFVAAASRAGLSLVSEQQRLVVMPGDADVATLMQLLRTNHVVVVMKLSQCADAVKELLRQQPAIRCHYFENVGTVDEYYTNQCDEVLSRQIPYFSLCILFPA